MEVKEQPLTPIEIEDDGQHAFSWRIPRRKHPGARIASGPCWASS